MRYEESDVLAGRASAGNCGDWFVPLFRAQDKPTVWVVIMWQKLAKKASARDWNQLSKDEQSAIVSAWTDEEGRIEMLTDSPADIVGMVAALYDPENEGDKRAALNELGKMVCATFAAMARKSCENLWKKS